MFRLRIGTSPHGLSFDIPSFWGLSSLRRLAASVGLGQGFPSPTPFDWPPPGEEADEYHARVTDKGEALPLMSLAYPPAEGNYLPDKLLTALDSENDSWGSLEQLREDLREISSLLELRLPADLTSLQSQLGATIFALERYSCAALSTATELALEQEAALNSEWYYPRGVAPAVIPYRYSDLLGFGDLVSASIDPTLRNLEAEMLNGFRYSFPLEFLGEYAFIQNRNWVEAEISADRWRIVLADHQGHVAEVSANHLVLLGEPRYEGYTDAEKEEAAELQARHGPFRLFPPEW